MKQEIIKQIANYFDFSKHFQSNTTNKEEFSNAASEIQTKPDFVKKNNYEFEAKEEKIEHDYADNDQHNNTNKVIPLKNKSKFSKCSNNYCTSYGEETQHMYDKIKQLALMSIAYEQRAFSNNLCLDKLINNTFVTYDILEQFKQEIIFAIKNEICLHQNLHKPESSVSTYSDHSVSSRPMLKTTKTDHTQNYILESSPPYLSTLHSSSTINPLIPSIKLKHNSQLPSKTPTISYENDNKKTVLTKAILPSQASTSKQFVVTDSFKRPQWANLGSRLQIQSPKYDSLAKPLKFTYNTDLSPRLSQTSKMFAKTCESNEEDPILTKTTQSSFDEYRTEPNT